MKICYILNRSIVSGPNIVALSNLEKIHEFGNNVHLIFLKGNNSIENSYPFLKNIKVTYINKSLLGCILTVRQYIQHWNFDIVHSHCFYPDLINIMTGFHKVKLSTIHNVPCEDYLIRYGNLKGWLLLKIHLLLLRHIQMNICISNVVKMSLPDKLKKHVIYNPVRSIFRPKEKNSRLTILYCGHLSYLKNPLSIIKSLKNLDLDFDFIALGEGEMLHNCKELVNEDPRFSFLGRVENVHDYFSTAHCLIHFSQTEGFCLSVAEALVSGMHVITNDLPIFAEINAMVPDNKMFVVNDRVTLQECLSMVIRDTEDLKLSNISMFSEKTSACNHLQLYKTLLK